MHRIDEEDDGGRKFLKEKPKKLPNPNIPPVIEVIKNPKKSWDKAMVFVIE